jgi:hypothetical protein
MSIGVVLETINGHALVILLMATTLTARGKSRSITPALYEPLAEQ